jgi:hypothetical protein
MRRVVSLVTSMADAGSVLAAGQCCGGGGIQVSSSGAASSSSRPNHHIAFEHAYPAATDTIHTGDTINPQPVTTSNTRCTALSRAYKSLTLPVRREVSRPYRLQIWPQDQPSSRTSNSPNYRRPRYQLPIIIYIANHLRPPALVQKQNSGAGKSSAPLSKQT